MWDPYYQTDINQIELLQHRVAYHVLFHINHREEAHETALVQCSLNWVGLH